MVDALSNVFLLSLHRAQKISADRASYARQSLAGHERSDCMSNDETRSSQDRSVCDIASDFGLLGSIATFNMQFSGTAVRGTSVWLMEPVYKSSHGIRWLLSSGKRMIKVSRPTSVRVIPAGDLEDLRDSADL